MGYETAIALRYLGSPKKNHFISVITVISCAGVAIGVWALIVVLSVMAGFEEDLKGKILDTYAHVLVDKPKGGVTGYGEVAERLDRLPHVLGASPFLRTEVMISSVTNLAGVTLKGVIPSRAAKVNHLRGKLVEGELGYLEHPAKIPAPTFYPPQGPRADDAKRPSAPGGGGEAEPTSGLDQARHVEPVGAGNGTQGGGVVHETDDAEEPLMPPMALPDVTSTRVLPGVVIGAELKKSLLVLVGDEVTILSPLGDLGPTGPIPRSRTFRVAGVFYTGMYEYDAKMVYVLLGEAQAFLGVGDEVTGIELRTDDPESSDQVVPEVRAAAPGLRVRDWRVLNASLFSALLLEKVAMFLILALVTIVASFNIVASLVMVVLEKKREVAILKALGATDRDIGRIFVSEGLLIGLLGMALGVVAGVASCWAIATLGIPLDREVYYISQLPVKMHALDIAAVAGLAVVISFVATMYPARLAARLLPAEGLRHE